MDSPPALATHHLACLSTLVFFAKKRVKLLNSSVLLLSAQFGRCWGGLNWLAPLQMPIKCLLPIIYLPQAKSWSKYPKYTPNHTYNQTRECFQYTRLHETRFSPQRLVWFSAPVTLAAKAHKSACEMSLGTYLSVMSFNKGIATWGKPRDQHEDWFLGWCDMSWFLGLHDVTSEKRMSWSLEVTPFWRSYFGY